MVALQEDIHALLRGGGSFELRSLPAGTLVIREGEVGDAAYIVQKGKLQVFKAGDLRRVPTHGQRHPARGRRADRRHPPGD